MGFQEVECFVPGIRSGFFPVIRGQVIVKTMGGVRIDNDFMRGFFIQRQFGAELLLSSPGYLVFFTEDDQ